MGSQLWREILKDQIKVIFSMLPFISPIVNLAKIVRLSQIDVGDVEAENIQLQMGSLSNWEPFLESLPQFIVQLYLSINNAPNTSLSTSIVISILSLSLASASTFL